MIIPTGECAVEDAMNAISKAQRDAIDRFHLALAPLSRPGAQLGAHNGIRHGERRRGSSLGIDTSGSDMAAISTFRRTSVSAFAGSAGDWRLVARG
ncbi:hypothetical protein [Variovorax sp. PAMC 28711]|uniref:hypothetical protein n=1 Tax=Variovorax sp. PAMC 28711 TaxID=1795631 RepID=UPI0012E817F9|nr:hypothetical protein [Variovorax sp. PAMC 28711]